MGIVNVNDLDYIAEENGNFAYQRKKLAAAARGDKLGCSLYQVEPGKKAFPFHAHLSNEEAIFVLEGRGRLRLGKKEIEISKGDYIAMPAGPECAHQIKNIGKEVLVYLAISTMSHPDVILYPDSEKVGVFAGTAPGGPKEKRTYAKFLKDTDSLDYYQDEN